MESKQRKLFDGGLFPEVRGDCEEQRGGLVHTTQGDSSLAGVDIIALLEKAEDMHAAFGKGAEAGAPFIGG